MGIDCAFALQLLDTLQFLPGKKNGILLGRQKLSIGPGKRKYLRRALATKGLPQDYSDYQQEDGFAENFLSKIGFPRMQSMDYSEYENCSLVHDLNDPIPDSLRNKFDIIIDGGTIEHVFNTPQSLDNVFHMLSGGGLFISINGMSGWAGHGFYQFSPELVWRYWQDARECDVLRCRGVSIDPAQPFIEISDTGKSGARFRARKLKGRWYLFYVIQKSLRTNFTERIRKVSQSDYSVRWSRNI